MSPARLKTLLALSATLLTLISMLLVAASFLWSVEWQQTTPKRAQRTSEPKVPEQTPAGELSGLFERRLQSPLYDPPPPQPEDIEPEAPVVQRREPPPQVQLLATMTEEHESRAMFLDRERNYIFLRVGQEIGDGRSIAVIAEIGNEGIKLQHEGQLVSVPLEKEGR